MIAATAPKPAPDSEEERRLTESGNRTREAREGGVRACEVRAAPDFWVWRLLSTLFVCLFSPPGISGKWAMVNLGLNGDLDRWDSWAVHFEGRTGEPSPCPTLVR